MSASVAPASASRAATTGPEPAGGAGDRDHASVEGAHAAHAIAAAVGTASSDATRTPDRTAQGAEGDVERGVAHARDQRRVEGAIAEQLAELPDDREPEDDGDRADRPQRPLEPAAQVLGERPADQQAAGCRGRGRSIW